MKNWFLFFALAVALMSMSCLKGEKASSKGGTGSTSFAQKLPDFSLKDPDGNTFTNESFSKGGLVLVVTAPILKNSSDQEKWNQHLLKAKEGSKAKLAYLEDMQPSFSKDTAIEGMKKDYKSGKEPILLIDDNGAIRKALKAPAKETIVLVYSGGGKLLHSETGEPSAQAAETIWKKTQ